VRSANWDAVYETHVDMNEKDSPVTLIYKAAITQNTGEVRFILTLLLAIPHYKTQNWENVPLTLETATPTSGLSIPALRPWFLSWTDKYARYRSPGQTGPSGLGMRYRRTTEDEQLEWDDKYDIQHQRTTVTSKGNVSASFKIPGLITVPSSGQGAVHNVTIAQMTLAAEMSWVSVPKVDFGRVHLEVMCLVVVHGYNLNHTRTPSRPKSRTYQSIHSFPAARVCMSMRASSLDRTSRPLAPKKVSTVL
jgi:hypothetical protein